MSRNTYVALFIIACAGLLMVIARDLVKLPRIRKVMRTRRADQAAFLVTLLGTWGTDPGGPPDFDGDGAVDIDDFLALLGNWGPCT